MNSTDQRDASRVRRAQDVLQTSDMLSNLTDQVPGVVYQYLLRPDGSSCFPFSSRGMNDIYEYAPEDLWEDATPVFGRLHPDDYDRVASDIAESARTLEPFHCEFRVVLPRQGLRWRLSNAMPQRTQDGGTLWYGVISDVTAQVHALEALRESRTRFDLALRSADMGVWDYDVIENRRTFDETSLRLLGIDPKTFTGSAEEFYAAIHPDDVPSITASLARVIERGEPYEPEYRAVWPDGSVHWIAVRASLARDEAGRPETVNGIMWDVTERKLLEAALQQRLIALTQPPGAVHGLTFSDLFDVEEIQSIQDAFSDATGVASIITDPEGNPITRPSNFCRLCIEVIRGTGKGLANCLKSDAEIGSHDPSGPVIKPCLSGGLWDAGASIYAGGEHVGNWLIGQVRNERQDDAAMLAYADEIGADRAEFASALAEVPVMSVEQFELVSRALFALANELSIVAYQNVQQARFITERQQLEEERTRDLERLRKALSSTVDIVSQVVETRDPYTAGHQRRVARLAARIAQEMDMDAAEIESIRIAGLLHDVGKMSIPAEILNKPGALSPVEFELIKAHAESGYRIISLADLGGSAAEIAYQHHERCDGSGYPRGLKADELLLQSKILAVADVVEAMMSHRPYRPACGLEATLAEIAQGADRLYDAGVVRACDALFTKGGFEFE